jgi:dCMP deaminase|tara:strand:+ start:271 stop:729 length:459 start_codon:yes stop_codon:yes gene_type:complete
MKGTLILSSKWDKRFMQMAKFVASWSKDPSTQVGAIAVRNRTVIAQGYNGFPRGIGDTTTRLDNRTEKYKFMVHAEMNVIYNAAENGVSLKDSTVYVYGLPVCSECAKGLIQAGIKRIVTPYQTVPENWQVSTTASQSMFGEVGIRWDWLNF